MKNEFGQPNQNLEGSVGTLNNKIIKRASSHHCNSENTSVTCSDLQF